MVVGGYAYALGLKRDAERAVKRASGVDTVVNNIEELPPNQNDDQIRWATYYKIYRDPFLSRYAPGGGLPCRLIDDEQREVWTTYVAVASDSLHRNAICASAYQGTIST